MINDNHIHIRVDNDTRRKWLELCQVYDGSTQSKVFREIVFKLYELYQNGPKLITHDD